MLSRIYLESGQSDAFFGRVQQRNAIVDGVLARLLDFTKSLTLLCGKGGQ